MALRDGPRGVVDRWSSIARRSVSQTTVYLSRGVLLGLFCVFPGLVIVKQREVWSNQLNH